MDEEAPIFDQVMENGRKLLDSIESPEEKQALKSKLDDTEKAWNDLQKKIADDLAKEEDVADKTKALDDKMADLEKKLDDQEKKLRDLDPVSCDPEQLDQQQKETNVSILQAVSVLPCNFRKTVFGSYNFNTQFPFIGIFLES